jgi:hypothetical protein
MSLNCQVQILKKWHWNCYDGSDREMALELINGKTNLTQKINQRSTYSDRINLSVSFPGQNVTKLSSSNIKDSYSSQLTTSTTLGMHNNLSEDYHDFKREAT